MNSGPKNPSIMLIGLLEGTNWRPSPPNRPRSQQHGIPINVLGLGFQKNLTKPIVLVFSN